MTTVTGSSLEHIIAPSPTDRLDHRDPLGRRRLRLPTTARLGRSGSRSGRAAGPS